MKKLLLVGIFFITLILVSCPSPLTPTIQELTQPDYQITLSPASNRNFGSVFTGYGTQDTYSVTVNNTGKMETGALTVALSGTNAGSFTLSSASIANIAVGGNGSFTIRPNNSLSAGNYNATVTVSGDNGITASFNVSFTVNTPVYSISLSVSGTHNFSDVTASYGAQNPHSVTVTNTGNQPTGVLTAALSGSNPGSFTLSATSISSIAVGGNANFTVVPNNGLGIGTYTAIVTVSGGNSITANFNVSFVVSAVPTYGISLSTTGTHTFAAATAGYGAQTPHSVTVNSTGNQATGALTVALSGANAGSFTVSRTSISNIASGASDNFTVVPRTGLAVGTYTATITVSGGNGISQSFTVSFTVNPVPVYSISLTPSGNHTFSAATAGYGAQATYSVTVTNNGNQLTGGLTVALSGANSSSFALSTTSITSIAVGGNSSFTVVPVTGLLAGTYNATVTVSGGNGISQSFNVNFTVNPVPVYSISLSTSGTHTFTAATVGYTAQSPQSVTVTNTGNQPTGALTVALSGTNASSFTLSTTSIGSITVSGNNSFTVVPNNNLAVGTYTATVTVSGGNSITASFNVSFTVQSDIVAFKTFAAGSNHTLAIKEDGSLWAWGLNENGQLGDGTTTNRHIPVQIGTDTDWVSVSAGGGHSMVIKTNGSLWAWGNNANGRLGNGETTNRHNPVQIGTDTDWASVSAGNSHTMAIKTNGTIWAWGSNGSSQLGDGTSTQKLIPTQIGTDTNWSSVSAGGFHTMAIKTNGSLWAWGSNGNGRLGDGTTTSRNTPRQIGSDTNWSSVSAGNAHTMAIKTDGSLWAWGNNAFSALGLETSNNLDNPTPTRLGSDTNWSSVSAGNFHTMAIKTDGSMWAWGTNSNGRLGDGTISNRHLRTQIGTDTDWVSVSANNHTIAIRKDGTVWAWGLNTTGQLGDGTTTDRWVPTRIDP